MAIAMATVTSLCCGGDKSLKEDFQRHFASKYHLDWMSLEEAEVLKVSSNMFHALKVVFANEVGRLSQSIGASSKVVMENFCKDQHLNISEKYLKPGFAFGGPCLGKDVHVMEKALNLDNFLPEAILQSNETHLKWVAQRIEAVMKPPIFILGASFKSEAKDYRDSAVLELVRQLRDRGLQMIASEKIFSSQGVDVYEFSEALSKAKSVLLASHSLSSTERDALAEFRGIIFDLLMTQQNEVIRNHSGYSPLLD